MLAQKILQLAFLSAKNPIECYDRVGTFLEVRRDPFLKKPYDYRLTEWKEVLKGLGDCVGRSMDEIIKEPGIIEIENKVGSLEESELVRSPFRISHNADLTLARLCYLVCRGLRPNVVLETGVAHGVTSAFILQALAVNGQGVLHSVDLPPLGAHGDDFVGALIPRELRSNWRLHRGTSKRVLPRLLSRLGAVDIFIHDSLHTYRHMGWEFRTVTPFLTRPYAIISDDVDGNAAFSDYLAASHPTFSFVARGEKKESLFGASIRC